jgi:hypothetical protein
VTCPNFRLHRYQANRRRKRARIIDTPGGHKAAAYEIFYACSAATAHKSLHGGVKAGKVLDGLTLHSSSWYWAIVSGAHVHSGIMHFQAFKAAKARSPHSGNASALETGGFLPLEKDQKAPRVGLRVVHWLCNGYRKGRGLGLGVGVDPFGHLVMALLPLVRDDEFYACI